MLRFSIVIPSLNQGRFIGETLSSIAGQNYPAVEVIIRDGGSTDDTAAVVKGFGPLVTAFVSESDNGQSDALNRGFAQATGDIFGWMNADDHYLPGAFAEAARIFEANPAVTVVYGNWVTIDEAGHPIRSHYALKARTPHFSYENLDSYNQALFWRREAHERFGRFDENLHRLMDDDLILALLLNEGPARFRRSTGPSRPSKRRKSRSSSAARASFPPRPGSLSRPWRNGTGPLWGRRSTAKGLSTRPTRCPSA